MHVMHIQVMTSKNYRELLLIKQNTRKRDVAVVELSKYRVSYRVMVS